jgi:type VI secretion system protein ImpH
MAGENWGSPLDLKPDLLKEGHAFSFFQIVRLLRLLDAHSGHVDKPVSESGESIWIRPELSLAFPPSDVARIEEIPDKNPSYQVTATFLGLYGVSSPLPTFYTEDLMAEASGDESVTRDFLDFINHRIFTLFFECWTKYRQYIQVVEEKNEDHLKRLFCLLGLGEKQLRENLSEAYSVIRYIGLFTQFPRSALGLRTLLRDALEGMPVEIIPCVARRVKIPPDQRFVLGGSRGLLGDDALVGEEIEDRMGKFRVRVGPLTREQFQALLPEEPVHQRLHFLTRFYLNDPLEYDLELVLAAGEAEKVALGALSWSRLGWDTWIFSGEVMDQVSARFQPSDSQ